MKIHKQTNGYINAEEQVETCRYKSKYGRKKAMKHLLKKHFILCDAKKFILNFEEEGSRKNAQT